MKEAWKQVSPRASLFQWLSERISRISDAFFEYLADHPCKAGQGRQSLPSVPLLICCYHGFLK